MSFLLRPTSLRGTLVTAFLAKKCDCVCTRIYNISALTIRVVSMIVRGERGESARIIGVYVRENKSGNCRDRHLRHREPARSEIACALVTAMIIEDNLFYIGTASSFLSPPTVNSLTLLLAVKKK